jgi:hypothetical protein
MKKTKMLIEKQIKSGDEVNLGSWLMKIVGKKLKDDAIAVLCSYNITSIRSLSLGGNRLTFEAIIDFKKGCWDNLNQLYLRNILSTQTRMILGIEDARSWPRLPLIAFICWPYVPSS